jgi:hypothetical protein
MGMRGGGRTIYGAGARRFLEDGRGVRGLEPAWSLFTPLAGGNGKVSIGGADGSW